MQKQRVLVPKGEDPAKWQNFINQTIPLIEETDNERGLLGLRNKAIMALVRQSTKAARRVPPVDPESYEGSMTDFQQFAYEHYLP